MFMISGGREQDQVQLWQCAVACTTGMEPLADVGTHYTKHFDKVSRSKS